MDKNLRDIEDLFKKALGDNEENPSQNSWDEIEKKLDRDNVLIIKKKYDLLKKVALLLLFITTGLSIYLWKNQDKHSVTPNNDISVSDKGPKPKEDTLTDKSGAVNMRKQVDTFTINTGTNVKLVAESENKIVDKPILENKNSDRTKYLPSIASKNLSNTTNKKNKVKFKKSEQYLLSDVSIFSIPQKSKFITRISKEVAETKTHVPIDDKRPAKIVFSALSGNDLPAIKTLNPKTLKYIKSNSTDVLATEGLLQNISLSKINPLIEIEKTIEQKSSKESTKQSRFAIMAFYSPDIVFYHFENNDPGNSNNPNFEKSETESYSSTLGALIDYKISNHWGLRSGITLATSNFNLESETLYAQPDNAGIIQYKLSTALGDAFLLPSFSKNPNIGDSILSKSTTHTLQYLEIPFAVKYNFNKGRFTLNTFGGISANFLTRRRLTTELEGANDTEFESTDKINGLKQFYFNGLAGIGLDYNFYKKVSVSFSPTFRFALNSINHNVPVTSFANSLGLGVGLKMKL